VGVENRIDGHRYPLIVFAVAQTADAARSSTPDHLVSCGWVNAAIHRVKQVDEDLSKITNQKLREAASSALDDGYAIVAYQNPITN
jgi:hypothetical protein